MKLQRELEEQFGTFKDENTVLKDRVRKLKTIFNGLSSQVGTAPKQSKTAAAVFGGKTTPNFGSKN